MKAARAQVWKDGWGHSETLLSMALKGVWGDGWKHPRVMPSTSTGGVKKALTEYQDWRHSETLLPLASRRTVVWKVWPRFLVPTIPMGGEKSERTEC